jgi:ADP-ribose pyrophosphatase YjhB (NUDIX family)
MSTAERTEPAAAVAIVRAREPHDSILLMRRTERPEDPWSGHWSYPGGRREECDLVPLHTALRELEEECGVRLAAESMQRALHPALAGRRSGPFMLVAPFVFNVDEELATVIDPEEAVEARWMPLRDWRDPAKHVLRPVPNMPENLLFPAINLSGVPVWGFTYRLTTEWLGLFDGGGAIEQAGMEAASRILSFLTAQGLRQTGGWEQRDGDSSDPMIHSTKVATVAGTIPQEAVMAHVSAPAKSFPAVNVIEVRPEFVRVIGLAFEEYLIRAE